MEINHQINHLGLSMKIDELRDDYEEIDRRILATFTRAFVSFVPVVLFSSFDPVVSSSFFINFVRNVKNLSRYQKDFQNILDELDRMYDESDDLRILNHAFIEYFGDTLDSSPWHMDCVPRKGLGNPLSEDSWEEYRYSNEQCCN